jgi:aspartyl protease family protein
MGIWLLVVAVLVGVVALAAKLAPGAPDDTDRTLQLIYLCVILAALILIYSYRSEFGALGERFSAELIPANGTETGPSSIAYSAEADGHYHVYGAIDGSSLRFMVDSGATDIVLSPADARMLGMQPDQLDYTLTATTANGIVRGAPIRLKTLKVGPIVMHDVPATVNEAEMPVSLLGMEFLRRLKSWGVKNGRLTFEQ